VPFFLLIGSLNTTSGMRFWRTKWYTVFKWMARKLCFCFKDDHSISSPHSTDSEGEDSDSYARKGLGGWGDEELVSSNLKKKNRKTKRPNHEKLAIKRARTSLSGKAPGLGRSRNRSRGRDSSRGFHSDVILGNHAPPPLGERNFSMNVVGEQSAVMGGGNGGDDADVDTDGGRVREVRGDVEGVRFSNESSVEKQGGHGVVERDGEGAGRGRRGSGSWWSWRAARRQGQKEPEGVGDV